MPVPTGRRLTLVPTMPSFPPFDGVAVPSCAGTRADGTIIRAIDARNVDGKSLPITTSTKDHDLFSSHLCDHGGGIWSDGCTTNAVGASPPDHLAKGLMAPLHATTEAATPSPSSAHPFLPTWSSPTHPLPTMGGSAALVARRALERSRQRLALAMSKYPGFADEHPWVIKNINAVALELQCWYQQHSIH
jgi:hypothetical protein